MEDFGNFNEGDQSEDWSAVGSNPIDNQAQPSAAFPTSQFGDSTFQTNQSAGDAFGGAIGQPFAGGFGGPAAGMPGQQNLDDDLTEEERQLIAEVEQKTQNRKRELFEFQEQEQQQKRERKAKAEAELNQWRGERAGQIQLRRSNNKE